MQVISESRFCVNVLKHFFQQLQCCHHNTETFCHHARQVFFFQQVFVPFFFFLLTSLYQTQAVSCILYEDTESK